jgi:hypothetical protein
MKINRIVLVAAMTAMAGSSARAQTFTHGYEGDALPDDPSTNPQWTNVLDSSTDGSGGTTTKSVSNGILTINTQAVTDYVDYRISGGPGSAWNATGAGTTLEMRLKTDFNAPGADWAGAFVLATQNRGWVLGIGASFISSFDGGGGGDLRVTTNDGFHIFRFVVADETNGPLSVYVDNATTPAHTWPGVPGSSNRVDFGDITAGNEGGQIQWDYLRWTNQAALIPVPVEPTWAVDQAGDWNKPLNWGGSVPNAVDAVANLYGTITSSRTVYSDSAITVGTLRFDNTAGSYQITGNGSLTIAVSSGVGSISVLSGAHKINLPLIFASNTNIAVANGATLTIGNPTTINAGKTVTSNGNVLIQAPLSIQAGGTLVIGSGAASLFGAPSLDTGASIDVKTNAISIDYSGQADPSETIRSQLASGFNGGAWNGAGINTSSSIANQTGVGWKDSPASKSITVKYTYYGDADLDGAVSSVDFNALVSGYGKTSGANWADGDFDYDGKVTTKDFNYLAGNFGATPIAGAELGSVVPEPASTSLLLGGLLLLAKRRLRTAR